MLAKRLSNLSCNHEEFAKATSEYEEAMLRGGHKSELKYEMSPNPNKSRTRKRKIIWFNPTYCIVNMFEPTSVGIASIFNQKLSAHSSIAQICNNNVKLRNSSIPDVADLISKHYKIALKSKANFSNTTILCNCRVKASYPLKKVS